jgi:hypothetical protein
LLSNPSAWISRAPAAAFRSERLRFAGGLGVVVGALPTGSVTSGNRQPSESGVVHDHIRFRQHQIASVACIVIGIGARHMKHTGTTDSRETVGGSSCAGELSSGGGSIKMISDGCAYDNRKISVEGVGEHLLPSAQAWGLEWPGLPVGPGTGNRHVDPFSHLIPGQALVTQLPGSLVWRWDGREDRPNAW